MGHPARSTIVEKIGYRQRPRVGRDSRQRMSDCAKHFDAIFAAFIVSINSNLVDIPIVPCMERLNATQARHMENDRAVRLDIVCGKPYAQSAGCAHMRRSVIPSDLSVVAGSAWAVDEALHPISA